MQPKNHSRLHSVDLSAMSSCAALSLRYRSEWSMKCRRLRSGEPAQVIHFPAGTKIWLAAGVTDMRRGFDGLSAQVQSFARLRSIRQCLESLTRHCLDLVPTWNFADAVCKICSAQWRVGCYQDSSHDHRCRARRADTSPIRTVGVSARTC